MKKILLSFLTLILCLFIITGCGNNNEDDSKDDNKIPIQNVTSKSSIYIFLQSRINEEQIKSVEDNIKVLDGIEKYDFKSRIDIMKDMMDSSDTFKTIMSDWSFEDTPIQDVFIVYISSNYDIEKIAENIKNIKYVDTLKYSYDNNLE